MKSDKAEILIDKYLAGELNDTELLDFNNSLETDTDFANEVKFQEDIMASIRDVGKRRLRQTLNDIHEEESNKFKLRIYSWKIQTIAATLLITILLGSGIVINDLSKTPSQQVLFEEYFSPESALLSVRSDRSNLSTVDMGMNFYVQEDYEKAIESFQLDVTNMLSRLYTGFSLMHLGKYGQAEIEFEFIITDNNNLFIDQAEWNLGLCYLVSSKTDKASNIFTSISKGNTVYNKKALQLLTEMGETN